MADLSGADIIKLYGNDPAGTSSSDGTPPAPLTGADIIKRYQEADVVDVAAKAKAADETMARAAAPDPYSQLPTDPAVLAPNMPIPTSSAELRNLLAPAPGTTYGSVLPIAKDDTTGALRIALPSGVRDLLTGGLDLTQGPAGMTVDPSGNPLSMRLTPQATMALTAVPGAVNPLQFGKEAVPAALAAREAPLSVEFKDNPLALATDRPGATMARGVTEPSPVPLPPPAASVVPTTAAEAKQVASSYYAIADKSGGTLTPQFTNKFIDSVTANAPQTEAGQAVAGQNAVTSLVERLQALRDKPMTLQGAQEVDEAFGNLIDKEYGPKGITKDGKQLADIQRSFRDQIANAGEGDVTGDAAGFDALATARKAWSQAMKMDDLERIQTRADLTLNPATSVQNQVRTILTNRSKSRGYDPDELAALKDAAERGVVGSALHVFGSRLIPLAAGAAELGTHGVFGGLMAGGVAHVGSTYLRNAASALQEQRLTNAMKILGRSVPPPPTQNLLIPPP